MSINQIRFDTRKYSDSDDKENYNRKERVHQTLLSKYQTRSMYDPAYLDNKDPNYDPNDDEQGIEFDEFFPDEEQRGSWKRDNEAQIKYKIKVNSDITKLYENPSDAKTFVSSVGRGGNEMYRHILVKLLVSSTYGKSEEQRKLIMGVLTELYNQKSVGEEDIDHGFGSLFSTCMEEGEEAITSLEAMVALGEKSKLLSKATVERFVRTERVADANALVEDAVAKLKILKRSLDECYREYFTSSSYEQCARTIMELNDEAPFHYEVVHYEAVKRGIRLALDKDNKCRELMSRLLAYYTGTDPTAVLQANAVHRGFELLVQHVNDLYMDVPDVLYLLSCFIARAIVDEALPPSFLEGCRVTDADMGNKVLRHVEKVLAQKNSYQRLARVWVSGKDKSVAELKEAIKSYIREYFVNGEMDDTVCNLKDLAVPYFDHEIVKQIIVLTCDFKDKELALSRDLLTLMCSQQLISARMIQQGFSKVASAKDDYLPDIPNLPNVYNVLREAVLACDQKLQIDAMLNLSALPLGSKVATMSLQPTGQPDSAAKPAEDTPKEAPKAADQDPPKVKEGSKDVKPTQA